MNHTPHICGPSRSSFLLTSFPLLSFRILPHRRRRAAGASGEDGEVGPLLLREAYRCVILELPHPSSVVRPRPQKSPLPLLIPLSLIFRQVISANSCSQKACRTWTCTGAMGLQVSLTYVSSTFRGNAAQAAKVSSSFTYSSLPPFSSGDIGKLVLPEGMQHLNMGMCGKITGKSIK